MILEKKMPAQTAEKSQFLVRPYNDVTIRYILWYPGRIQVEVLRQAVEAVVKSVDVLHGSLHLEQKKIIWRIWEDIPEYAYFRYEENENVDLAAVRAALEPVDFDLPVKLHTTLIQGSTRGAVIVRISHLVADGGDSRYLLRKVIEAYNLILRTGSAEGLVVKNGSRDPAQVYAHLSRQAQKGLWKNPMSGPKNEFPFQNPEPGEARMLRRGIDREVMAAARSRGKEFGATANDLILTAVYRAFGATPGVDQREGLCVAAMMDLRRHCPGGDSAGLTNLAGALSTVLPEGVQGSYTDTLRQIVEQTQQAKNDPRSGLVGVPLMHFLVGKLPVGMLMKAADMVYGSMALGFTNMGNLRGDDLALGDLLPVDAMLGGPVKKKPGVQLSVLSLDGSCSLAIVGEYADQDIPELNAFLERIVREISDFSENP